MPREATRKRRTPQEIRDASITEKELQAAIRGWAEDLGWKVAVTWSSINSPKGWPDLFMVRPLPQIAAGFPHPHAEAIAIECKTQTGKVSPEQIAWLDLLRRLPGVVFADVIRPSDWYAGTLDEYLTAG